MSDHNSNATGPDALTLETVSHEPEAAHEGNGKRKTGSELLAEVRAETDAKTKPKPGKKDKGKGKGKDKPESEPAVSEPAAAAKPAPAALISSWIGGKTPEGTEETLPRKQLILDPRLQHRKELQDTKEGGAVERYAEMMKDGAKFPRVRVVRNSDPSGKGELWVIDGFQRTGAYEVNKTTEIPCVVYEGTFGDALYLSLASNGENSVLPRTKEDIRRSIFVLMDNAALWAQVAATAKGNGGLNRVVASACNCSVGATVLAFTARGYKVKGDKLVPVPKEAPAPASSSIGTADAPAVAQEGATAAEVTPEQQKQVDTARFKEMSALDVADKVKQAKSGVRKMAALVASLVADPVTGDAVKEALAAAGLALAPEWDIERSEKGAEFFAGYAIMEHWPIVPALCNAIDDAAAAHEWARQGAESIPGTV